MGQDLEFPVNGEIPAAIPDGQEYQVMYLRAESGSYRGRQKVYLWFKMITPGDSYGHESACRSSTYLMIGTLAERVLSLSCRPLRRLSTDGPLGCLLIAQEHLDDGIVVPCVVLLRVVIRFGHSEPLRCSR